MTQSWKSTLPNFDPNSYYAGVTSAFAEVVGAGVKQLALSHPYTQAECEAMLEPSRQIAAEYGVTTFVEDDLLVTLLFPASVAAGKFVIFFAQDQGVLDAYQALKVRSQTADSREKQEALARDFGRLLSYSPDKIEAMLANNTQQ